jgi:pimeloyl-ACP methyl ester carboxylesterase
MARGFSDESKVPEPLIAMQMLLYAMPGARESFERRLSGLRSPAARAFDLYDRLGSVRVPVLLISGDKDHRGSFTEIAEDAKRIPDIQLRLYKQCGHWPHVEYPDAFNRDVLEFLNPQ